MADDAVVAEHERLSDDGQTRYDWQHYIPLVQRKPGALRNGAPFADLPAAAAAAAPRRCCARAAATASWPRCWPLVPTAGLEAVLVAVELALESAAVRARQRRARAQRAGAAERRAARRPDVATALQVADAAAGRHRPATTGCATSQEVDHA